jgi:hypothetical protein
MVTLTEESLVLQVGGWVQGQPPSPGKIQLLKCLNQRMPDGLMDRDQSELNRTHQTGRPLSSIEEDGRNWFRSPELCIKIIFILVFRLSPCC